MKIAVDRNRRKCAAVWLALLWLPASAVLGQEVIRLKIADSYPPGHYLAEALTKNFMQRATELSNGVLQFEYYPAQQIGKLQDYLSLTQAGAIDIGYIVPSLIPEKMPHGSITEMPGLFDTTCQGTDAFVKVASYGGALSKLDFEPNGVRFLTAIMNPPVSLITSKKRVTSLEDIKGLKIRTPGGGQEASVQALGAVSVRMAAPEVYESISRGTIDGVLFPFLSAKSYDLQKEVKYVLNGVTFGSGINMYAISERRFKQLPPAAQQALVQAGILASRNACETVQRNESATRAEMIKAGIVSVDADAASRQQWQSRLDPVVTSWAKALDQRGKQGTTMLDAFRNVLASQRTK